MIRASHDAIYGLLDGIAALTVHDGLVPNLPPLPYAVMWASGPLRSSDRLSGSQGNGRELFSTTCVGSTAEQVAWVQDKVHAALVDASVSVSGRRAGRIKHEESAATAVDYDADPPVITAVDTWALNTFPA